MSTGLYERERSRRRRKANSASFREAQREANRRYSKSAKGQERVREYQRRWRNTPAGRAKRARQYAAKRGAVIVETFDPLEIFERADWHCGVCGLPVDRALDYPHAMSATLDHIKTISQGGEHSRANVRLAHARCNRNVYWHGRRDTATARGRRRKAAA